MTRRRSAALIALQRAISGTVRPQPKQRPERASSVQIFTQGLSIIAESRSRILTEHNCRERERNRPLVASGFDETSSSPSHFRFI
jgi:hypothetical protein